MVCCWCLWVCVVAGAPPAIVFQVQDEPRRPAVVAPLPANSSGTMAEGILPESLGRSWLCMKLVDPAGHAGAPILADYSRRGNELRLVPRYSLAPAALYRAELLLPDGSRHSVEHRVSELDSQPPEVLGVFPTADRLPANQLKFYILFSQPMREGREIFDQIGLVDDRGQAVADPWRPTELWTADARRLTLWIHPGRVKRGVNLREEIGPVLKPNREYKLLMSTRLLSAAGQPLVRKYEKRFRVAADDHRRPLPSEWILRVPTAGTTEPLQVEFPESLDRYLIERYLRVVDARGEPVAGRATIGPDEQSWSLTPAELWQSADYQLLADENLEDLAGNTPARVFDTDLNETVPETPALGRSFHPATGSPNRKRSD